MSDKLPKVKHNHTLTDILKASIFSLVMMAPVTAIGVTCAYVVCNKNAYQSYSDEMIEKTQSINTTTQIQQGDIITWNYINSPVTTQSDTAQISFTSLSFNPVDYGFADLQYERIQISSRPTANYIMLFEGNNYYYKNIWGTELTTITIVVNNSQTGSLITPNAICYKTTYVQDKLDNVFYYAVDTMQNNTLFSWTKTTAIYTPVNAMTTGMGINTPAIAVLLVYWLLCTAVYIIIDIVVKGFTWLTHLIGER